MGMLEESNNGASHPKSLYFSPSRRGVGAPVASRYDPRSSASKCKVIWQGSHREVICLQLLALKNPKNLVKAMNTEKRAFWRHRPNRQPEFKVHVSLGADLPAWEGSVTSVYFMF